MTLGKTPCLPSVFSAALGKELVRRVPEGIHSSNIKHSVKLRIPVVNIAHGRLVCVVFSCRPNEGRAIFTINNVYIYIQGSHGEKGEKTPLEIIPN